VRLTSYHSPRHSQRLLRNTTIWEAGRATSAAPSFFDPTTFPGFGESFVDGATGANNPIYEVWTEAQDMWQSGPLEDRVKCLVSIGTGVPSLTPFKDDLIGIGQSLQKIATETEKTAEQFLRDKFRLDDTGRYYRFNVSRGLENIGLEDSKQMNVIIAATERYIDSQTVFKQIKACAYALSGRTCKLKSVVLSESYCTATCNTFSPESRRLLIFVAGLALRNTEAQHPAFCIYNASAFDEYSII
jgi:hypothetical protein